MKLLNFLLTALSTEDRHALMPLMEEVSLIAGQVLVAEESQVDTIYFPGNACISIVSIMKDGKAVETSTIGRESAAGLLDVLTFKPARSRVFVQVAGSSIAIPAKAFRRRIEDSPSLLRLVLLHIRASAIQAEQGVACNISHGVQGRLARWLLMTHDRVGASTFPLTQEYMAVMTGVQRSTVSNMASQLKKAQIIDYSRGNVTIRDRPRLEQRSCECYDVIGREFGALRDGPPLKID